VNVYFLAGIGGDNRIFRHIQLPPGFEIHELKNIQPERDETIGAYALRVSGQMDNSEPYVLVGLSFGGILATEIARYIHPVAIILMASVPLSSQLPSRYTSAAAQLLHDKIPVGGYKILSLVNGLFRLDDSADKKLFREMVLQSDPEQIRWAMGAVVHWQNDRLPESLYHIHGERDEVFPVSLTRPTHIVAGAGHMLLLTHYQEINRILEEILLGLKEPRK
jgi:pimeloyl-ACP methyl ester carboxylesterase